MDYVVSIAGIDAAGKLFFEVSTVSLDGSVTLWELIDGAPDYLRDCTIASFTVTAISEPVRGSNGKEV